MPQNLFKVVLSVPQENHSSPDSSIGEKNFTSLLGSIFRVYFFHGSIAPQESERMGVEGAQRLMLGVFLMHSPPYLSICLSVCLSIYLSVSCSVSLSVWFLLNDWPASPRNLSPPLQGWHYSCCRSWLFLWMLRIWTRVLMLSWPTLALPSHLTGPLTFSFYPGVSTWHFTLEQLATY